MISYADAMTVYMGFFSLTMVMNCDFFWGPESPLM